MAQTVSTKLPDQLVKEIDVLVDKGVYLNRSEALRESAREVILTQQGSLKGKVKEEQLEQKLLHTFENQDNYSEKNDELADYMSENYSWTKAADRVREIIIATEG